MQQTKKSGKNGVRQRYYCYICKKTFEEGSGKQYDNLWELYQNGKQTYAQLADYFKVSKRTIQRQLDKIKPQTLPEGFIGNHRVCVLMDTTYFGRGFGLMLFKDAYSGRNLYYMFVKHEAIFLYEQGLDKLKELGYEIVGIVCDGKPGLLKLYPNIPTQMCQFHQVAIVRRYLSRNPKLLASKELWELTQTLCRTDKESFVGGLADWYAKWESFLGERTPKMEGQKSTYKHKKLRSAYLSLKRNLPFLFIWYDNIELNIPNTTNAIDGFFADLKNKLRCHNGLTNKRKVKFIRGFLKA